MTTFAQRLGMAAKVDKREMQLRAACHDTYQIENVVDALWEDFANEAGREILASERERIQRAHDRLAVLLANIGTEQMQAAE